MKADGAGGQLSFVGKQLYIAVVLTQKIYNVKPCFIAESLENGYGVIYHSHRFLPRLWYKGFPLSDFLRVQVQAAR